ncbi:NAD(P)-dependent oxidoreductase [Aquiflexum gelatinilyticum]|uniref:Saccharopine dehydrogenase [NAD(+), L-lysine-forming] n=1 Tax=Aquiflexum gelatinilyticum TaxID=2961943 RepID=A0A9X2P5Y6_9BACT|nr:NAD(P)-dependent oxidoreductase [Aquiflexum gelatinilyticum]MCR9014295.1 NAD(P)-dependent oxidoreductase [Aquiflexum gelatinilyticum]MCS4435858.1 NAD(P)-dependent oxidoreductase [Aquiflexum gelatinilyticum]
MKIGLIKEGKVPTDRRVPFTPKQLSYLSELYRDSLSFYVESSPLRCFSDDEYIQEGIEVVDDISFCDLLMGVKEVPVSQLIPNKSYIFFSHTIKEQPHNRKLLQSILEKNITLMDYEVLKDENGNRTVAFGHWAGIVGAYNGLWTYGKKSGLFDLKRALDCFDKEELEQELVKVVLPPIKIVVTGTGRVGKGVVEVLEHIGIKEVGTKELLLQYFDEPVFTVLSTEEYYRRKTDGGYERQEFYSHPEKYESHFLKYTEVSDILMAAAYWDPKAPKLFKMEDISSEEFSISVIADITCDIDGSIPTTIKTSSILNPIYDIDRESFEVLPAFGKQTSISVMAIDNLPTELPRNASEDFGSQLIQHLIPELLKEESKTLDKATIAKEGDLTIEFIFLNDYVNAPED